MAKQGSDKNGSIDNSAHDIHVFFLESLDQIDSAIRKAEHLSTMMEDVLDSMLSIFNSDRAWLLYPCDPTAPTWSVPMERTRTGFPGALSGGVDIPMLQEAIDVFEMALQSDRPVTYDTQSNRQLPPEAAEQFQILSQISLAIYPKSGKPWLLGMHQCSHHRIWTQHDQELFHEVGRRIADSLNTMLLLENLRKSEERYREVVNNSPDLIYRANMKGELTFVSDSVESLSGYTAEEAIGLNLADEIYVNAQDRDLFLNMIMQDGLVENFEAKLKHKNGSIWWASTNAQLIKDIDGNILGIEGITRNITERKLADEERQHLEAKLLHSQKMEAIGTLSGGIAHDLNNMLSPIIGYAELLLLNSETSKTSVKPLKGILDSGFRARDLIQQLLAFSRKQTLQITNLDLNLILHDFENLLHRTIREDIELDFQYSSSLPVIRADRTQIEQVIMNLMVNAQDAIVKNGRISVQTLEAVLQETDVLVTEQNVAPGNYVILSVCDTGIGIEPKIMEQIFEPFFSTKGAKGTGLGLATVYGIIKQHDGAIKVFSQPDQGTTVKIYLPVSKDLSEPKEFSNHEPAEHYGTETILLVEDDPVVIEMTESFLKQTGYNVLIANNGKDAFKLLQEYQANVHLLLTDVIMPQMNGQELFTKAHPLRPDMKVLYMSGYHGDLITNHGVLEDGTNFIQKPFSLSALSTKIREILND